MSVLHGPDGGPPIGIKITPEDFHDVATRFVSASEELFQTQTGLLQQLGGLTGVAGVDTSAKQFDQSYQAAMQQWITGVYRAQNLLGDIANGIDWSARNHWMADASAVPGGGTPVPWQPVNPGLVLPSRVNAPSLVGNPQFDLPPWLSDHVPLPRLDALQELVTAFHGTRDAIENITSDLHNGLEFLFSNNSSPDLDALSEFWDKIGGASDSAILTALSRTCDDIASAIGDYSSWAIDAQNQIGDAVLKVIAFSIGGLLLAGLFTAFTEGVGWPALAEVATDAGLSTEVSTAAATAEAGTLGALSATNAVLGAMGGGVVGMMSVAINSTPDPDVPIHDPSTGINDDTETQSAKNLADQAGRGRIDQSAKQFSPDEQTIANRLADEGHDVTALKESDVPNVRTPDATVDGVPTEFKTIDTQSADSQLVRRVLNDSARHGGQARDIVINADDSELSQAEAMRGIKRFMGLGKDAYDKITIWGNGWTMTWP